MSNPLSEGDLNEIREAIFAGRTIEAIKLYREFDPGAGLKEAKDAVEAMEKKLREESPQRFRVEQPESKSVKSVPGVQDGKGCFGVFIVVLAMALTLVIVAVWG
jgi:Ribosomal protein L7/L12 C-terminal domain